MKNTRVTAEFDFFEEVEYNVVTKLDYLVIERRFNYESKFCNLFFFYGS